MKRAYSLHRDEFQRAWDDGKSWSHPLVILRVRANTLPICRFGFVAGKKLGKAVTRNRAKRRCRAVMRQWLTRLMPGHDLILIARAGMTDATFQQVESAVATLLQRAALIKPDESLQSAKR